VPAINRLPTSKWSPCRSFPFAYCATGVHRTGCLDSRSPRAVASGGDPVRQDERAGVQTTFTRARCVLFADEQPLLLGVYGAGCIVGSLVGKALVIRRDGP
jgi:hypothetical protein